MKFSEISESTTAGSVASVAMPLGNTQKRAGSMFKGKKTKKKFYEGKMKEVVYDLKSPPKGLSNQEFKKKYGKSKEEMKKSLSDSSEKTVSEAEINEDDLILVPGQGKRLKPGFIPHDKDRTDHEVEMARSDLFQAAKNAKEIYTMIKEVSEEEGLEGWVQEKIIKANDYLNTVREYLEHKTYMNEGGVLAGGMSNFEEASDISGLMAASKLNKSFIVTAKTAEGKTKKFRVKAQSENVAKEVFKKHHSMAEILDVKDEDLSEAKKDACYNKVKSRYKVWPSAYASGALVKCRKVGASNWGNKSKK
jgi:hypothetical protein